MSNYETESVTVADLHLFDMVAIQTGPDALTSIGVVVGKRHYRLPGEPFPTHRINGVHLTLDIDGTEVTRSVHREDRMDRVAG